MKSVLYGFAGLLAVIVIVFGLNYMGLVSFKFFAPKYENAKREVYENTQSYVEGKRQAITKYYDEWRKSDSVEKNAIRSLVLQDFANFNLEYLLPQQMVWYNEMTK